MDTVNKVEVVIGNEIITLVSGENEDYMQKLARYIDRKLAEIKSMKSNASLNERMKSLFIALNIADDYYKAKEELAALQLQHERFVTELGRMQEENFLLQDKIYELQGRLNQLPETEPPFSIYPLQNPVTPAVGNNTPFNEPDYPDALTAENIPSGQTPAAQGLSRGEPAYPPPVIKGLPPAESLPAESMPAPDKNVVNIGQRPRRNKNPLPHSRTYNN
jgi:cell division protein ZapA